MNTNNFETMNKKQIADFLKLDEKSFNNMWWKKKKMFEGIVKINKTQYYVEKEKLLQSVINMNKK